ncbi:hypothetical protein OIU84_017126 [Salix udensis]|uniref:Uncharacterized protein n=1 Tax=Salix udensis TaxID=889485 RepID=A0AAD6L164_9ROSI|nr:hypothetical protein OIU84_017126 [Salix udensis]
MGRGPCCDKNGVKKGPWTPEEDDKLTTYIQLQGPGNWRSLPKNAGLQRCGKSCRLRWTNYLRPDIKRGKFSFEEEETIIQLHSILGNRWSAIAARLPGRTDNEIKNYWNTHIRKRLLRNGIDPVTHAHLLDLSSILSSALCNPSSLTSLSTLQIQENQLCNSLLQNHAIPTLSSQPSQFQNLVDLVPACISAASTGPFLNQTTPLMPANVEGFSPNPTSTFSCRNSQESFVPFNEGLVSQPCFYRNSTTTANPTVPELEELSGFQSPNNGYRIFSTDSVISTRLTSPGPLNSPSTLHQQQQH